VGTKSEACHAANDITKKIKEHVSRLDRPKQQLQAAHAQHVTLDAALQETMFFK